MRRPIRQRSRRIRRWTLYQQNLTFIEVERKNEMKDLNEDGATAVLATVTPWAMKYCVLQPFTHRQDSSDVEKTTEQSPPTKGGVSS